MIQGTDSNTHSHHSAGQSKSPVAGDAVLGGLQIASNGYSLEPERTIFEPGTPALFIFRVRNSAGRIVTVFDEHHEKRLHLVIVRRDLSHFQHLHPAVHDDGECVVELTLAEAGFYRAFADFVVNGTPMTLGVDLAVAGDLQLSKPLEPEPVTRIGNYEIESAISSLHAGEPAALTFPIRHAGQPVLDLEPYLGASGHLVALREGDLAYLHVHPMAEEGQQASVTFHTTFPSPGRYRLFLQFAHSGTVHTVAFGISVPPPASSGTTSQQHSRTRTDT